LVQFPRVTADLAAQVRRASENLERYEQMLLEMEEQGVWLACWEDRDYPPLLREIGDAPLLLYLRGQWQEEDDRAVAIVGSREASPTGCALATQMAAAFAERGLTVVSGFALGIDTAAHVGALDAGGRTIGVLGNGIDRLHPSSNRELAERTVQQGVLLTEFPPGTRAQGRTLMARDRIISGLSRAVIVIEAGVQSGSMDTASRARKQGRRLYAIDWTGTEIESGGTAQLIREGALALPPRGEDLDFAALVSDILGDDPSAPLDKPVPAAPAQQLRLFG
jgi:DNA processing protein